MHNNIILFLTACINPNGMAYTALSDVDIRKQQYIDALYWYLRNTDLPILFVENSNYDISESFKDEIKQGRLEMLTFDGNNYDRSLGKGYGEARILQYGLDRSTLLRNNSLIIKVTGRFICKNINEIVKKYNSSNTVYANIGKDDWGGNIASSVFVIAPTIFWTEFYLPKREQINDSKRYHFEHLLYDSICQWKSKGKKHNEFWTLPGLDGVSGTSGDHYHIEERRNLQDKVMYFMHKLGYRGYFNPLYKGNPNFEINRN